MVSRYIPLSAGIMLTVFSARTFRNVKLPIYILSAQFRRGTSRGERTLNARTGGL